MYIALGFAGVAVARLVNLAPFVYGMIAVVSIVGAIVTLWGAQWLPRIHQERAGESLGLAAISGAGFGLVVSPCCTPLLGVIVTYAAVQPVWWWSPGLMLVFGIGHASPLAALALGGTRLVQSLERFQLLQGAGVVAASAMLAVGLYYALMV